MKGRILVALFVAYVAATAIHIGFVIAHEPFAFDAWNVTFTTRGEPITAGRFFDFWWHEYTHSNPRIGQPLTYLAYKLSWFAELATPLAYLAIATAVTILGLGRWPWQRARDLALWSVAIGFGWFVYPELGRNMFCRAYSANYVYAAALLLWFLVPLRMAKDYDVSPRAAAAYGLAGLVAGLCNEHTGPALVGGLLGYAFWRRRNGGSTRLLLAGGLGALAGFLALFFSPGQAERYEGLGSKVSIPMRVIRRGVINNLDIVRDYIVYASPLLALLVVLLLVAHRARSRALEAVRASDAARVRAGSSSSDAADTARAVAPSSDSVDTARAGAAGSSSGAATDAARPGAGSSSSAIADALLAGHRLRDALRLVTIALVAGLVLTLTLFASPRLGTRFYYVSLALLLAAVIAVVDAVLVRERGRVALVVLAAAASIYAAVRTIPTYVRAKRESDARLAQLAAAPAGSTIVVDSFTQVPEDWWFIGDDFRVAKKRELVAEYRGLAQIQFRDSNALVPLGISNARIVARAAQPGAACPAEVPLDLVGMHPFDVPGIQRSIATTAASLAATHDQFEVTVEVPSAGLPAGNLPRPKIVLARWRRGGALESYAAMIDRPGASTTRELVLSTQTRARPFDIYMVQVGSKSERLGSTADAKPLRYVPWRTGIYWAVACDAAECWILAAGRNHAL